MRDCKDRCRLFKPEPTNYNEGRKACRTCRVFIKTADIYCPCCSRPLAYKPRANENQRQRRLEKKMEAILIGSS